MSGIAPLGPGSVPSADYNQYRSNGSPDAASPGAARFERESDSIEISPQARRLALLDRVLTDPPVRHHLVDHVRREIESGRYETPGKIDRVAEEIWNDHFADDHNA